MIGFKSISRFSWILFVIFAATFASFQLLQSGLTHGYDVHYHMNRLYQYQEQFFAGQFYPRWLEGSHAGYGSPTLIFYPPMFIWGALPFAIFGLSLSQQLIGTCVLALITVAVGTYGYMRLWLPQSPVAWQSGILFACCSPYLLFNVYFRGAYAEAWAMAWLVWVLWGMLLIARSQRLVHCIPLAIATALVVISHIPTVLILGIFGFIAPWLFASEKRLMTVLKTYAALVSGLLLAAFFLLPALSLQRQVNTEILSGNGLGIASNRFIIVDLLKLTPKFNELDRFDFILHVPFFLALTTVVIGFGFIVLDRSIATRADIQSKRQAVLLITGIALSLFMMTDLSMIIYRYFPSLDKIQFSWRWLALAGILMPLVWAWFIHVINIRLTRFSSYGRAYLSVTFVIILTLFSVGYVIQHDRRSPSFIADTERIYAALDNFPYDNLRYPLDDLTRFLMEDQTGRYVLSDGPEYMPQWVVNSPNYGAGTWSAGRSYPLVDVISGEAEIEDVEWQYGLRQFRVNAQDESELALRMFAWPGWRIRVGESFDRMERLPQAYEASTGRLSLVVPAGEHAIEVKYVGSQAEHFGWFWSGLAVLGLLSLWGWDYRQQKRLRQITKVPVVEPEES